MRQVWSQPGGEAHNYRNAMVGAGTKADNHSDLTAAETPETTKHLGRRQPVAGGQGRDRRSDRARHSRERRRAGRG